MPTSTTAKTPSKKGIDFVVNPKKEHPYPDWMKQHRVFKELSSIDKVFPRIGLTNFKEPCEIMNSEEAIKFANALATKIVAEIGTIVNALYGMFDRVNNSKEQDREKTCAKLQEVIFLYTEIKRALSTAYTNTDGTPQYLLVKDGKTTLQLRCDIFLPKETKPTFKKGEGLFRVLNKLKEMQSSHFVNIDQLQEFKDYSRTNVGKSIYNVVFSSTGEDGQWDIATASMRGISSCQAWGSPQSRGLIGTMTSKYTAIIYMESNQPFPPYGTKMLYRSMVRFCINTKTKKPVLVIDKMYPSVNDATLAAFKRTLNKKSGMDVMYAPVNNADLTNWYIPSDETTMASMWATGEVSYMDTKINVSEHKVKKIAEPVAKDITSLTEKFRNTIGADLDKLVKVRREEHNKAFKALEKEREQFFLDKLQYEKKLESAPFDKKQPKLDKDILEFFKNGVDNMFNHCDKKYGANTAGKCFSDVILNAVKTPDIKTCISKEEYHKHFLMNFVRDHKKIREIAKAEIMKGTWAKSFPKSTERFYNFVYSQMKGYILGSMKELLKGKAN